MTPAEVIANALAAHSWNSYPKAAHAEHNFDSHCGVCLADLNALGNVALYALAQAGLVVVSAEDLDIVMNRGDQVAGWARFSDACERLRAALPGDH